MLISAKPFIICLEAVLVGVMVRTAVSLSAAIPLGTSTKRGDFLKEQISRSVRVFLKRPFRPCPLGCGRFLSSVDSHDRFLQCLGIQSAEAAFVDGLCVRSARVTMAALRSRLSLSSRGWEGLPLSLPALASLPQAENHRLVLWAI